MRLIGLDPGLASFGIAVARLDPYRSVAQAVIERVEVVRTQKADKKRQLRAADDTADRLRIIALKLASVMSEDVVAVCIEASALPYGKIQTSVVSALGRVRGLIDMLAAATELPVIEEGPQVLKKIVTGSRSATKQEVQAALERRFPELASMWPKQRTLHEHAADAVAAIVAGLESDVVRAAIRGRGAA